jgi:hypothetical protein
MKALVGVEAWEAMPVGVVGNETVVAVGVLRQLERMKWWRGRW